jgi:hypothetical protein
MPSARFVALIATSLALLSPLGLSGSSGAVGAQGFGLSMAPRPSIDSIPCQGMEGTAMHIHPHLAIIDRGNPVTIPADVGRPKTGECLYWLHTHTADGILHVESPTVRKFTLRNFFDVWGQPLSATQAATAVAPKGSTLKVWVDGKPYTKDPGAIELLDHRDIVIEAGPPFPPPPKFTAWGGK